MRLIWISVSFLLLIVMQNAVAGGLSSLEERMSQSEFHASGLDKLSPDELKTLNAWLHTHASASDSVADRTGLPAQESHETIASRIEGAFNGWSGKTVFKLQNGQVWKQMENDTFATPELQSPEVTIAPGMLGGWTLKVSGYNRGLRVQRIR